MTLSIEQIKTGMVADLAAFKAAKANDVTLERERVLSLLERSHRGVPKRSVANVLAVLREDSRWSAVVGYDAFRETPVVLRQPPQRPTEELPIAPGAEWTQQDATRTGAWLATVYGLDVPTSLVTEAVLVTSQQRVVHPVRDYFGRLTWDGVPRVDGFFSTYCDAPIGPYAAGVSRILFLSAVARVLRPGCKVDTVPILEGPQGIFKSSMLRELSGAAWFADTPIMLGDKDAYQALRGAWIYELAELAAFKGRDATRIKSFASSPVDHYRPSYEPRARSVPRHCIFVGTTNEEHYLADATGARRFWPVRVGRIDLDRVRADRDQLWAEAHARIVAGEPWWPSRELDILGATAQEERFEGDPWEEPLRAWLLRPVRVRVEPNGLRHEEPLVAREFTIAEVLEHGLCVPRERQGKGEQSRATQILRRAGWVRDERQRRIGNERVRLWSASATSPATAPGSVTGAGDK